MRFASRQIKGRGRARTLGFPTINLEIPKGMNLESGIYGAYLHVDGKKYLGALHFGTSPTFNDEYKSCEIYLVDLKDKNFPAITGAKMEIELLKRLRDVIKFDNTDDLIAQIKEDVREIMQLSVAKDA